MNVTTSAKPNATSIVAEATAITETDTVTKGIHAMKFTRRNLIDCGMRKSGVRNALKKNGKNSAEWNIGD